MISGRQEIKSQITLISVTQIYKQGVLRRANKDEYRYTIAEGLAIFFFTFLCVWLCFFHDLVLIFYFLVFSFIFMVCLLLLVSCIVLLNTFPPKHTHLTRLLQDLYIFPGVVSWSQWLFHPSLCTMNLKYA